MNIDIITSRKVNRCVISHAPVTKVLDFGQHAYADTFITEDQLNLSEPVFPLQVNLCPESGMIQLGYVSHAQDRYNLYSYSYTSSNNKTARDHWDNYADVVLSKWNRSGLAVEIGSNDGYLIRQFQHQERQILGIDSSEIMCKIAEDDGVPCVTALFDETTADQVRAKYGPASIIMANNVFNHANDPVAFARGVAGLLSDNGIFVFEVPYWLSMIESGRFTDMVYHEHPSYFTIKSVWNLLKQARLEIVDFDVVNYHGGSLRVFAQRDSGSVMSVQVEDAIARETQVGLFDVNFYQVVQRRFEQQRDAWLATFYRIRQNEPDAVFIGVGAAAKANTWLTWHGLNKTHMTYVTDASEHKQGKYTPLSRIPILSDQAFAKHDKPYAVVLSWNIAEGLRSAILNINPNARFLTQ